MVKRPITSLMEALVSEECSMWVELCFMTAARDVPLPPIIIIVTRVSKVAAEFGAKMLVVDFSSGVVSTDGIVQK